MELGINFIDTAIGYGEGESENFIGNTLQGKRQNMVIATKFTLRTRKEGVSVKDHILSQAEESLTKLKTEYIDLYQIHTWKSEWKIEDTLAELLRYKDQGTIRYIGVSNFSANQISRSDTVTKIQSCQPHYSILFRASKSDPIDLSLIHI